MKNILAPVIPKPKTKSGIMLSGIGILQLNFYDKKKIKNEEAQGILKFGNFCEFLRFLETFWLLFVFFY